MRCTEKPYRFRRVLTDTASIRQKGQRWYKKHKTTNLLGFQTVIESIAKSSSKKHLGFHKEDFSVQIINISSPGHNSAASNTAFYSYDGTLYKCFTFHAIYEINFCWNTFLQDSAGTWKIVLCSSLFSLYWPNGFPPCISSRHIC